MSPESSALDGQADKRGSADEQITIKYLTKPKFHELLFNQNTSNKIARGVLQKFIDPYGDR